MYIHELKNWPKFEWDNQIITKLVGTVRHQQGIVLGKMHGLGFEIQEETLLKTLTMDVIKSSEIEGEVLNKDQVRSSIARRLGIEIAGIIQVDRHVEGIVEMMLDATQNFKHPLTRERLFDWHSALFPTGRSGMYKIKTGAWRESGMQVTSGPMGRETIHFEAPTYEKIDTEMKDFLSWIAKDETIDDVLKAGLAHLWFITIHPFDDGNGRIARAITDMLLARADKTSLRFYSMSAQIQVERKYYYEILEQTQKGTLDVTEWLVWFLECLMRSMKQTDEVLSKTINRVQFWDKHKSIQFNPRQQKILHLLLDDFFGKLSVSKYSKITKISTDTALRDLQDLVRKEILEQYGSGRGTGYRFK